MTTELRRKCKNPGCTNLVPPAKPGHRPPLSCSDACRKAASRAHLRNEARRQEEQARQQRQARWQTFQPATQHLLAQIEARAGAVLAAQLAEAIWSERNRSVVTVGRRLESLTQGQDQPEGWGMDR